MSWQKRFLKALSAVNWDLLEFHNFLDKVAINFDHLASIILKPYNINPDQWMLILFVMISPGSSQKELSILLGRDQANVTRSLSQLEEKGLIIRKQNPTDKRAHQIYPTDMGIALIRDSNKQMLYITEKSFEGISDEEFQITLRTLEKINKTITHEIEERKKKPL